MVALKVMTIKPNLLIYIFFTHCIIKVNPNGIHNEFFTGAKPSICTPNGHENVF